MVMPPVALFSLPGRSGDVISVDWCPPDLTADGNRLRLQLDRVFTTPDGSLDSLELTEALA